MCQLTRYKLCTDLPNSQIPIPADKLKRCKDWPQLLSAAREGNDPTARDRLKSHMEHTQHNAITELVHVNIVLPGQHTCIPNRKKVVFFQLGKPSQTGWYYVQCDGSYRNDEGRLMPPRKLDGVRSGADSTLHRLAKR